jgi:1-acyl-sn-glycerol-3-phosphate acyltransferase
LSSSALGRDPFKKNRGDSPDPTTFPSIVAAADTQAMKTPATELPSAAANRVPLPASEPQPERRAPGNGAPTAATARGGDTSASPPSPQPAAATPDEDQPRSQFEELLRTAIAEVSPDLATGLGESELKALLLQAVTKAASNPPPTGSAPAAPATPSSTSTAADALGTLASYIAANLPLEQVTRALRLLDPSRLVAVMRAALALAESLLQPLNPRHLAQVDEFGYDKELTDRLLPFFDFMFTAYWRCDFEGVGNVPDRGRALLVANHSGVIPWDASMLVTGFRHHHPAQRHLRCLMLDLFATMPFFGTFSTRMGQIRACPENGYQLLERDHFVGVFPEGLKGIGKLYKDRYQLQRFGRGGYVRLAMRAGAPIIPASVVGGEEIYPLFYRADWLARLFDFPYFPITLTFPWLGLLGALPLPSKWVIQVGEPIDVSHFSPAEIDDDLLINEISDQIKEKLQQMLYSGLKKRRSVFLG